MITHENTLGPITCATEQVKHMRHVVAFQQAQCWTDPISEQSQLISGQAVAVILSHLAW